MWSAFNSAKRFFRDSKLFSVPSVHLYGKTLHINRAMAASMTNKIDFDYLKEKLALREVLLIDVRERAELVHDGMIPGSINIPLGQLEEAFKLPTAAFESKFGVPKPELQADNLVLTCKSGRRASIGMITLKTLGYENSQVYSGSFQDWIEKGGSMERLKAITSLEHL